MRTRLLFVFLLAGVVLAQRHKVNINTETPEGQALQQIGQESDEAKKLAACEKFVQDYPKSENLAWVYGEMQPLYVKTGQPDKAVAAGEKIMAVDPEDMETALATLKAAEAKKDPDLVKKWSGTTAALAQKAITSPQPKDEDAVEDWKKRVDYAKQVNTYSEYAIDSAALQTTDPRKKVELIEVLYERNPQSQYVAQLMPAAVQALQQVNDAERKTSFAEKVLAKDPNNEQMLIVAADGYSQKGKEPDKVISYSSKLAEVLNQEAKPGGVSDADWNNRKNAIACLAHYWPGKAYYSQKKYGSAEKELRVALPLAESNPALKPEILFMLGDSAYRQENIVEALKYFQQCAAMKSNLQAQAAKNVAVIKSQYRAVK
jgi:tetratricopeptide (TPR) repeat protein